MSSTAGVQPASAVNLPRQPPELLGSTVTPPMSSKVAKPKKVKSKRAGRIATAARRYNIKEVAIAAKVSVATVSRTLAMPDVVLPETRQRVQEAIRRLGYTPNVQARSL